MLRLALVLMLIPVAALAQAPTPAPASAPKLPASTAKPAAPKPPAPRPAIRKPAPAIKPPAPAAAPLTEDEKIIYALGILLERSIDEFDLSPAELDILKRAMTEAALNKPAIELDEWGPKIAPFARARGERVVVREKAASVAYLLKAAAETGAVKTESGLVYREMSAGTGASPRATDAVRV